MTEKERHCLNTFLQNASMALTRMTQSIDLEKTQTLEEQLRSLDELLTNWRFYLWKMLHPEVK